jgi:hypothetical protein
MLSKAAVFALSHIAGISFSKCWSTLENVFRNWKVSIQAMLTSILISYTSLNQ